MMIEHVDAIVDMRRHMTLEQGATQGKGVEVLDNLIATDNPGGFAPRGSPALGGGSRPAAHRRCSGRPRGGA